MASTTINKFFKYGVKGDLTSTVDTLLGQLIQASPSGNGIGILVDNTTNKRIIGLTAKDAKIDFTTLGGGTLSSAADSAAITFTNAAGQSGGSVTFGVTSGTSSYLTVQGTGSTANNITYGLTEAVWNPAQDGSFTTNGVLTSGHWTGLIRAQLDALTSTAQDSVALGLTQGGQTDKVILTGDGDVELTLNSASQITFGLAQAVKDSLALADTSLQGFTIDGTSAVTGTTGAIATTGSLTGGTAYNATTNPVATKAYVDAVDTKYNHTLTVASNETTPTTFGTWTPTADGTITINQYAGSTAGLVPAKTNATASAGYYLAETGAWTALPAAQQITFGSDAASSNTADIKVYVDGTAVSNTVTLTAAQDATTITGETLGITITGDANTPTIGLTADTLTELAKAHSAVQPLGSATTHETFVTGIVSTGNGFTVTGRTITQATDKSISDTASGTATFTVGNGRLQLNNTEQTLIFSANQTTNINVDQYSFTFTSSTLGLNTNTPTAADNKIATMADIAGLAGAMHYIGPISNDSAWPATPAKGDVYVATGDFTHSGITIESGDMIVFGDSGAFTVVNMNVTLGTANGNIAPVDMGAGNSLTSGQILVATASGIATNGFTFDAESTANTSTIGNTSTNAQVPTSKNVYDYVTAAIAAGAVQSVSETTAVSAHNIIGATITDTLTVDGTAQPGNAFNIDAVASSGIVVAASGNDTVTVGTTDPSFTATDNNASVTFATTATTGIAHGSDLDTMATGISDLFEWQIVTLS